jgi:hypothetical protein
MSSSPTRPLTGNTRPRHPGNTRPRHRLRRGGVLTAVFIAVSLCAAACGGGSGTDPSASQGSDSAGKAVAYAECMRAHGVPNFPEPGSENSSTGINMGSATFQSARAKCAKLSPMPPVTTHATEQQIRQALESTSCMRGHGFPNFPDPIVTSTPPSLPSAPPGSGTGGPGYTESYGNGILFKVPSSIDVSSPTFQAAAKACDSPLYNAPPPGTAPESG